MLSDVDKCTEKSETGDELSTIKEPDNQDNTTLNKATANCRCDTGKFKQLRNYHDVVYNYLMEGIYQAEIIRRLREQGYEGSKSNAEYYVKSIREEYGIVIRKPAMKNPSSTEGIKMGTKSMTKKELMECIWGGKGFTSEERDILNKTHPTLLHVERCVKNFKKIFEEKNLPLLYVFIEGYISSPIKKISDFARSLLKDINAVENSVASEKSNGFVEGTNNRIKMLKRTMFGRCGLLLLSAKLMFRMRLYT